MKNNSELIANILKYYYPFDISCKQLVGIIEEELKKSGLICRIFSRTKSKDSVINKVKSKGDKYIKENKKMQDAIGVRIVLYFAEDMEITINILSELFDIVDIEHDKLDTETFCPQRTNIVMKIPSNIEGINNVISEKCLIDNTFEVQIRTIFSEGWHEVEHDFRYKYKNDWNDEQDMARDLNGLFAVLEICDKNIAGILDNVAYNKYKKQSWESMIRNRFRLRFEQQELSNDIIHIINEDMNLAKSIFRFSKDKLVMLFYKIGCGITFNNVVFLINYYFAHNEVINGIIPASLKNDITKVGYTFSETIEDKQNLYNSIVSMKYI